MLRPSVCPPWQPDSGSTPLRNRRRSYTTRWDTTSLLARGDLADRSLAITLPPIPDARRRPEDAIWAEFDASAPSILAALLDGLVTALKRLPGLRIERLPRMADFARLACAAAPAFGWTDAEMLAALEMNRAASVAGVIEADPVADAVRSFALDKLQNRLTSWEGTASDLLMQLGKDVGEEACRERSWPRQPNQITAALKRAAPSLRRVGVDVDLGTRAPGTGRRMVGMRFRPVGEAQSQSSHPHAPVCDGVTVRDGCDDGFTPSDLSDFRLQERT